VVELSDVVLCVSPRDESDWEEGPALRRAQAAKQAQLAAAELAKLGSRVAATGSGSSSSRGSTAAAQANVAAAAAAAATAAAASAGGGGGGGSSSSWGWMIADYVISFLLNRLQVSVKNVHVYFQVSCAAQLMHAAGRRREASMPCTLSAVVPPLAIAGT
jgi:hypothetical protein